MYKWEVFGDLLEAVWYDPEEAPPPYSSCMGSLSEPDAERCCQPHSLCCGYLCCVSFTVLCLSVLWLSILSASLCCRVAFELSVGERFMKFSNGFENLIDPDGEFRCPIVHSLCLTDCFGIMLWCGSNALYIPDSHLREY